MKGVVQGRPLVARTNAVIEDWLLVHVPVLSAGVYATVRLWHLRSQTTVFTPDSRDYERISRLPVTSLAFFRATKPPGAPFLYKLLPGPLAATAPWAQTLIAAACWLFLAFAVAACLRRPLARATGFVAVLWISLLPGITGWDTQILSESLTLSLGALVVGLALLLLRRPRPLTLGGLLLAATFWVLTRDSNAYSFALLALPLGVVLASRGKRRLGLTVAVGAIAVMGVSMWSAGSYDRQRLLLIDAVNERVLSSPSATQWFVARGMPVSPNMRRQLFADRLTLSALDRDKTLAPFNAWLKTHGRATYEHYLLTHLQLSLEQPLRQIPNTLSGDGLGIVSGSLLVKLGVLLLGALSLAWLRGWLRREALLAVLLICTAVPNAVIVWDGEPTSIARHALQAAVLARLGILLAATALLDGYLSRRARTAVAGRPASPSHGGFGVDSGVVG